MSFESSRKWFGDASTAVGQSILVNNIPFAVIGVTPPEFFGVDPQTNPDFYLPLRANISLEVEEGHAKGWYSDPNFEWVEVMARLRPGSTLAQAQAVLAPQFAEWMRTTNTKRNRADLPTLIVQQGGGGLDTLRRTYSRPLYVLLALVALILTIACANIANLLLARSSSRKREMAVRLSMGAGRPRVIRQLLTESVLLALTGGVAGVGVAIWGIRSLTFLLANGRENFTLRAELNWHVLAVVATLSIMTGLLFGLAPALQSTKLELMPALKESRIGERGARSFRRFSLSRMLVVSQIAITLVILVAAGLFVRTLSNLQSLQLGFNRESVLTFQLNARQAGHRGPEMVNFYSDLLTEFAAIPGVRAASSSSQALIGHGTSTTQVVMPGRPEKPLTSTLIMAVGSGFFTTMQIPILLGRPIGEHDQAGSQFVAVVNETFARTFFPGQNPIGRHITFPRACEKCDVEVVGVSADALYGNLKATMQPVVFVAVTQGAAGPVEKVVYELRTAGNPLSYVNGVREIIRRADERLPLFDVKTQAARIDGTIWQEITFARLCSAFAILALAISCIGLYGTLSYNVARRTSEIGIRMALGAQRGQVVWMVLREVLALVTVALVISVPASLAASKLIQSFLFKMKPNDALALTGAVLILVVAAVLAGYMPARNASRIDPLSALRHE